MVRKTTSSKSAAKKADAKKRVTPKAGARASSSPGKAATRKGQPTKSQTKRVVKVASAKADQAKIALVKKPPAPPVKPSVVKVLPDAGRAGCRAPPGAGCRRRPWRAVALKSAMMAGRPRRPWCAPDAAAMPGTPAQAITAAAAAPKAVADKAALARRRRLPLTRSLQRHGFKTNEWMVHPAHVSAACRHRGAGDRRYVARAFVITFEKDKMTPVCRPASRRVGMRKLAEEAS
jgi:CarD family transcriptional regulator